MSVRFRFEPIADWPPLAWLAMCRRDSSEIVIWHGQRVEVADEWFCEAAWAGPYEDGGFDRTDIVAGSGGRRRAGTVTFVGSGSTIDRLQVSRQEDAVYVSNSLLCLIATLGIELDPCYPGYYSDFRTVVAGLDAFQRRVRILQGDLELCYFDNLVWDGASLEVRRKPWPDRDFSGFEPYRTFLVSVTAELVENARSLARRFPYRTIGTVSTGYDSPAVTALAKEAGNREVFSFRTARGGFNDCGDRIAAHLGLDCTILDRDAWRARALPEVPFLAANAYGEEMHFSGAEDLLRGRVVFTGFHGGKIWSKPDKGLGPDIVRADPSGLSLTEYRLWVGFLNCPVPFWGAREYRQIHAITHADEMKPWDVSSQYSQPLSRRIAEEAGVPREFFGQVKRAASVVLWNRAESEAFLTERSLADYRAWLRRLSGQFVRSGSLPPLWAERIDDARTAIVGRVNNLTERSASRLNNMPGLWRLTMHRPPPLFHFLFPWAVHIAKQRYGRVPAHTP
ncbi:hypothetical protein [Rhodospirillaceae bacterium SYSU D60014]|uniref:hypothetical protein n=1 Tax=Virgifigura deserti TaxID=2268457 RepID=UPI000E66DA9C